MFRRLCSKTSSRLLVRNTHTAAIKQPNFGQIAPVLTPFKQNGDVDYDRLKVYINFLVKNGVRSVFVNGTTGEFSSLTVDERKRIQAVYLDYGRAHGLQHVFVQCGSACIHDAVELAKHAQASGAERIAAIAPFYAPPRTVDALMDYCTTVSSAAPLAAFYYYHIPAFTKCAVSLRSFLTAADRALPALEGFKFSDSDLPLFAWTLHYGAPQSSGLAKHVAGRYVALPSTLEVLGLARLAHGSLHDGVGTQFNFMPGVFRSMNAAFERGDLAAASREHLCVAHNMDIVRRFADYGNAGTMREIMRLVDCDLGPPRLPLKLLPQPRLTLLRKELEESGFF